MINNSTFTSLILALIFNTVYSQETILDIPINKMDSITDISGYENKIEYNFENRYSTGINHEDSSAIKLGVRRYIEITPNNIPDNTKNKDIEILIDLKFGNDVDELWEFPATGSTLIIGAVDNIYSFSKSKLNWGFIFNYDDSTLTDNFGITNVKIDNINEWNSYKFNFNNSDSTIKISLNNNLISTQKIDSLISLTNSSVIGIGKYLHRYLHAHIDNIKIVLNNSDSDNIITSKTDIRPSIQENIFYNLQGNKLDETELIKGQIYIQKTLYLNGKTTTIKFLK